MGRNGSGKSTLLKQVVGLLTRPGSSCRFRPGYARAALDDVIRTVGYVPQHPDAPLFQETLADELAFTRRSHRDPPDPEGDLALLARRAGGAGSRNPPRFSGGESIAPRSPRSCGRSDHHLARRADARFDYEQKHRLAGCCGNEAEGRTIIMATHDVELAAACADRVVLMAEGQIVVDGPHAM